MKREREKQTFEEEIDDKLENTDKHDDDDDVSNENAENINAKMQLRR